MNFTYTIEPPPDNAWGGLQEDGTWNGMVNLVQNNIKDFGMFVNLFKEIWTENSQYSIKSQSSIFMKP